MRQTQELGNAISQHEGAINSLDAALTAYRNGADNRGQAEQALNAAAQVYERSSALVAANIIEYLPSGDTTQDGRLLLDEDASLRLAAAIAIDAEVASQAALLIQLQEPQELQESDTGQPLRSLTALELVSLGDDLVPACQELFRELRGETSPAPSGSSVATHAHRILGRAGDDVVDTLHAMVSGEHELGHLATQLAEGLNDWVGGMLPQVSQALSALRRLLVGAWRAAVFKIQALVGEHGREVLSALGDVFDWLPKAIRSGAALALGWALQADDVVAAVKKLVGAEQSKFAVAIAACEVVDAHHEKRCRAVRKLNRALPMLAPFHAGGVPLQPIAGVAVLIYSTWLAHDHLDSRVLPGIRLPKNPGLLTKISEAVGAPPWKWP
jgi:hypothetical protein